MTDFASNLYLTRKVYFNVEVSSKKRHLDLTSRVFDRVFLGFYDGRLHAKKKLFHEIKLTSLIQSLYTSDS